MTLSPVVGRLGAFGLFLVFSIGPLAADARATIVSWAVDADGDWNVGSNWSGGEVPALADTVVIDRGTGLYTVTVPSGTHGAFSIFSNENLILSAGLLTVSDTIQVNAKFRLAGGTLVGGVIIPGIGNEIVEAVSGTLDGVTLDADIDVSGVSNRTITIKNGLTLNGTARLGDVGTAFGRFSFSNLTPNQTLAGTGQIVMGNASLNSGLAVGTGLVIEPGLIIRGGRGTIGGTTTRLVVKCPIIAEVSGQPIRIQGDSLLVQAKFSAVNGGILRINGTWANQDTIEVGLGSTLDHDGSWVNEGVILITDAATTLGGSFTTAGIGEFHRTGGTVHIDGTLNNTGDSLQLDGNTGSWRLVTGGTILGGTVEPGLTGADLTFSSNGTLDGVIMNADMDLSEPSSVTVTIRNGLTLNGTATMGSEGTAFGRLLFSSATPDQILDGTGDIVLGSASASSGLDLGANLVIESDITIRGARGTLGGSTVALTNRGIVRADSVGFSITLSGTSWTNEGTVASTLGIIDNSASFVNADSVRLDSLTTFSGTGTFTQTAGSTRIADGALLDQSAVTIQGGTFTCGGTVNGELSLVNGTIAPGASPGLLTGTGGYSQTGGTVAVEIAGTDLANYDRLAFTGSADLAGTLDVAFLNGFEPSLDDTFTVMTYASRTDSFDVVNLPVLDPNLSWLVETAPDALRLIAELNPPPVALCKDTTLTVDLSCEGTVTAAALDDGTFDPKGEPFTLALDPPGPYPIGIHFVNFIATDTHGAADTCVSTVTVVNDAPVAACKDTTISVDNGTCEGSMTAAALDDGTVDPNGNGFTLMLDPPGPYALGANLVNFIATDDCGAADTCASTITVINNAPVVACRDTTVSGEPITCIANLDPSDLDDGTVDPDGNSFTLSLEPPGPFGIGIHQVNLIATDDCGAADTCTASVTVISTPPVAVCRDTTISVDNGSCTATLSASDLDNGTTDPDGDPFVLALAPPGPFPIGVTQVNFIATDTCGSADTCLATITVVNNPPVATCIGASLLADSTSCEAPLAAAALDNGTFDPEGNGFTLALDPAGPFGIGTHQVSFIATDDCGFADTCLAAVIVSSNPPTALAVEEIVIQSDSTSCTASVPAAAFDNGSSDGEVANLIFSTEPPAPYPLGVTNLKLIVSDGCESDTADTRVVVQCTRVGLPETPIPAVFRVAAAMPNPFRGATRIQLDLPEARHVRAQVFDVSGRMVAVLANETMSAGMWELAWSGRRDDGRELGAGLYLVRVEAGKDVVVRKALFVQ